MPTLHLPQNTVQLKSDSSYLYLGMTLCSIAGALNAGGFLAIGSYTSHMTGLLSSAADNIALGNIVAVSAALLMVMAFLTGSICTTLIVNYAKRNSMKHIYTPVFILEAVLLLMFGLVGSRMQAHEMVSVSFIAVLLCFMMGLQNALITKISDATIRTTHVTGLITDLGIECGKLIYWNQNSELRKGEKVYANRKKLRLHFLLITAFFTGGIIGAFGFKYLGFISTLPLTMAVIALAIAPTIKDKTKDKTKNKKQ